MSSTYMPRDRLVHGRIDYDKYLAWTGGKPPKHLLLACNKLPFEVEHGLVECGNGDDRRPRLVCLDMRLRTAVAMYRKRRDVDSYHYEHVVEPHLQANRVVIGAITHPVAVLDMDAHDIVDSDVFPPGGGGGAAYDCCEASALSDQPWRWLALATGKGSIVCIQHDVAQRTVPGLVTFVLTDECISISIVVDRRGRDVSGSAHTDTYRTDLSWSALREYIERSIDSRLHEVAALLVNE